ncbi:MAG: signal recognition particle receptor subunit alpha [archaeon]
MLDKLQNVMNKVTKTRVIDEDLINEVIKDIQRILIQADVSVGLVKKLTDDMKKKIKKKESPKGVSKKEYITKLIYNELKEILGGEKYDPRLKSHDVLLVGLYGSGKTTTVAKLANFYSKRGMKTCAITTDTDRPAAYEQLQQLGEKINIDTYGEPDAKNASKVLEKYMERTNKYDIRIIDSAGRDNIDKELLNEIKEIEEKLKPEETFLVISADTGQTAKRLAKDFDKEIGLTGVIVTKTDTSAKSGGALTACSEAGVPVSFIGTGEKINEFKVFEAEEFVANLLGKPDLGELLKRVQRATQETDLDPQELMKGDYNFQTFYKQLEAVNKMGSLSKIFKALGIQNKIPKEELQATEEKMEKYKYILDSMTNEELKKPDLMNQSRKKRISKGSGRTEEEIKELINHFNKGKKMIKRFKGGGDRKMKQMMEKMKKQGGGLF